MPWYKAHHLPQPLSSFVNPLQQEGPCAPGHLRRGRRRRAAVWGGAGGGMATAKLRKFLLRYYPPGIILQYEREGVMKQKPVDLLDLTPETDVEVCVTGRCACQQRCTHMCVSAGAKRGGHQPAGWWYAACRVLACAPPRVHACRLFTAPAAAVLPPRMQLMRLACAGRPNARLPGVGRPPSCVRLRRS